MVEIFIVIIVLIIFLVIRQYYKEKHQEEHRKEELLEFQKQKEFKAKLQKTEFALAERIRKYEDEMKRFDDLNSETIVVVYERVNDNGKFIAIVKRLDNSYASVERANDRFVVSERIALTKEKINKWVWYDDTEYQRRLTEMRKADLLRQQELEKQQKQNQHLDKFGIYYLYHITHKDNLQNILQNGLKSHNQARKNNLIKKDIADSQVNDRRSRCESIYKRSIHDYVPLYFNPKNPMLFKRNNIQNDIIILALDRKLLYQENIVFTDGNAAAKATSFYKNTEELNNLNWDCINAEYWNDFEDGKRLRCAEVLVYPDISINAIQKIFCSNEQTKMFVVVMIKNFPKITIEINSNLYFRSVHQQNFNDNMGPFNYKIPIDDLPF